ncbi:MAG: S8 family serine peptidase, partial [Pseudomonadales bacterium]|nr:S8 family serine peptidase [Pseudomonadales bacterium]
MGINPGQKDTPTFTKGMAPIKTGIKNIDDVDFAWKSTFPEGVLLDKRTSVQKRRIGSQAMNVHVRQSLVRVEGEKNPLITSEETFVQDEDTGEFTSAGVENSSANQLLVSTNSAESSAGVQSAHSTEPLGDGMFVVNLGNNATLDSRNQAAARLKAMPGVQHVEPNYILTVNATTPNDPSYDQLWGMHNSSDTDIDAPQAWDIGTGTEEILVGVIDSGFDYTHEDLKANAWTNPGESGLDENGKDKKTNGIDDDGNGYVDDFRGWDWVNNDNDPMDDNNHGTHCSGTIGGVGNNGIGVAGVAWKVKIVGLKFLSGGGSGNTADAIKAVKYATTIGVDLTSNSWGGGGSQEIMKEAIEEANEAGIMFIAAAGNDSKDNGLVPSYPAGYDVANVISVASTTSAGVLSSFSNYGATSVDIAAPGSDIYSTIPGNRYASYSGTSMATPAVSGAVALMLSENPAMTASEIRSQLLDSGRKMESLKSKVVTEAQMNVSNMLASLSGTPGEMESPEAGSYLSGSSETFYWTKGRFVTDFKLKIGSTAGESDVYESDSLGTVTSQTVDNLPVDDRDLYVTLSSQTDDGWENRTYQYASWGPNAKASAAELEKPVEDTVLNEGETYEFSWTTGSGLDQKWLKVGSEPNKGDYFNEQVDGSTKKDLTFDLFTSGKAYVTLESQDPYGQWTKKGY